MQNNQLNRLLKLINRTGDRLVVLDKDTEEAVVMMEIDEYEKILNAGSHLEDMSEADILDKINREVAVWREKNMANSAISDQEELIVSEPTETKTVLEAEKVVDDGLERKFAEVSQNKASTIAEEPITVSPIIGGEIELKDVPDGGEEERFYLEPI
jgi:PHD/YefM family antitoxin component YafN of YafNO toxin-antitoxin module